MSYYIGQEVMYCKHKYKVAWYEDGNYIGIVRGYWFFKHELMVHVADLW